MMSPKKDLTKYLEATESDLCESNLMEFLLDNDKNYYLQSESITELRKAGLPKGYSPYSKIRLKKRKYQWIKMAAAALVLIGISTYFMFQQGPVIEIRERNWNGFTLNEKLSKLRALETNVKDEDILTLHEVIQKEQNINIRLYAVNILIQKKEYIPFKYKKSLLENESNPMIQIAMVDFFTNENFSEIDIKNLTGLATSKLKNILR